MAKSFKEIGKKAEARRFKVVSCIKVKGAKISRMRFREAAGLKK